MLPYIIQNMGGQTLAQKVLPYLEITPIVIMKVLESEIQRQNLRLRLLEIQRRYEKEEDELN